MKWIPAETVMKKVMALPLPGEYATVSGNNRHGVEAAARRAIRLGAFWHRGPVQVSGFDLASVVRGRTIRYCITLDIKDRRRFRWVIKPIAAKGSDRVEVMWTEFPEGESHGKGRAYYSGSFVPAGQKQERSRRDPDDL